MQKEAHKHQHFLHATEENFLLEMPLKYTLGISYVPPQTVSSGGILKPSL